MKRKSKSVARRKSRRVYTDELKSEAVQMLLDGHSAESVASNLGLSGTNLLYRWKASTSRRAVRPPRRWRAACANLRTSCGASSGNVTC